ncbi:MAG: alpha-ketoglutarate-dependent dioxygenase AlkB family protein [Ilumatobacteraceae bacterium]
MDGRIILFSESVELLPFDGSAVLYRDFIGASGAGDIFRRLMDETPWEERDIVVFGKQHREPRLSAWHSEPHIFYTYSGILRSPQPWTPLLIEMRDRCTGITGATFNAVLANLYRDGNDGVGWHADNEACNGREPTIASLSFGASRRFDLRHRETKTTIRVQLDPGSLLVMSGLSQHCWVHQLPRTKRVTEPRINLTFRRVVSIHT